MKYWLVKSEPFKYSWDQFVEDGSTFWDGVRNYQARNNMREMSVGDLVLYYHSNKGKEIVGYAEVIREHYQDPTTEDERWSAVDLKPIAPFNHFVTLKEIKADERLADIALIKQSRLSVMSIKKEEFDLLLTLGEVK